MMMSNNEYGLSKILNAHVEYGLIQILNDDYEAKL